VHQRYARNNLKIDKDEIIRLRSDPFATDSGVAILYGNLAPDGAMIKTFSVPKEMHIHTGRARVFEHEDDAIHALLRRELTPGDVMVIRYEGPRANGMPEMYFAAAILSADRVLNTTTAIVTDGLLSFDAIAQAVAARAHAFGMRVIANDPYMAADDVTAHGATPVSFDELIEQSDYLVIQAPLTKETHHRIGEAELRRMKPTLILVNTARGPIVSDAALHLALKERWIAGAGLDDIEEEPSKQRNWKPENPLFSLDNVIITPHAAYYSEEAIRTVRDFAAHEVARMLTGKPPLSPVNAAQLAMVQPRQPA
jgi:D-isomer specific 2-hydroxyacid dehydrogenase-like protein/dehydratase family protein